MDKISKAKPVLVVDGGPDYNHEGTIAIRSRIDVILKITGEVTGQVYIFNGAGSIVYVDIKDKDELLNKKRGRACCGSEGSASLFELA